jgi:excisionase family DNA binding protein
MDLEPLGLDIRLTTQQAALYLGCSPQYLRNLRSQGEGPAWHKVGRTRVLYWKRDLDAYDEERRKNAAKWSGPLFDRSDQKGKKVQRDVSSPLRRSR